VRIELFEMERMQSLHWHAVDYDLSESGVQPMTIRELLGPEADAEAFVGTALGYPLSEGSLLARERIASWYPGCTAEHVTISNGGSEANMLSLWTLLEPGDRLAFMVPNYLQGAGLGRAMSDATDAFALRLSLDGDAPSWQLDRDELERAVTPRTKVVMVCNPNNPTGYVLSADEMDAVVAAADRVGAWIVADEIYRGAEVDGEEATPTFWGRADRVIVTSGLSKAFGMPGLRVGWAVAPPATIRDLWIRHDYTTLTPGVVSDALCAIAMEPVRRDAILARTRAIIRRQLPPVEEWIASHDGTLRSARPSAGAIAFVDHVAPPSSKELVERIRVEQSTLLVPGEMFGLARGFRLGFGYDLDYTLAGLARVDAVLQETAAAAG
jgi:aspartate/methionine/tyrosine aminotransferase